MTGGSPDPEVVAYDKGFFEGIRYMKQLATMDPDHIARTQFKLNTFDTALPLDWYDDVHAKTGVWPQTLGFVWCYDSPTVWGEPFPLTDAANVLLKVYGHLTNTTPKYVRD